MQSAYLCVVLHVKHKKLPFINRDFNLILGKNQDRDHFWWRHSPPAAPSPRNIPHLVLNIKGFPLKAKSFLNTATYQNLCGGVPSTSGLSLVPRWGYEFASTSEGWVRKEMYKKVGGKRCRYLHRHASTFFDLWQLNRHWNMLSKCNWVSTIQYCLLIPFSDG